MTPEHVTIVQESFDKIILIADQAAELFYKNLFILDPQLRGLFPSDMRTQGRTLMHMLGLAVHGLTTPDTLIPAVQELGRRHVAYGVEERHYDVVGKALMLTLEQGLGGDFTSQVRDAWFAAYELLSGVMKRAAYSKVQAA